MLIYKITNKINGKVYIGQTTRTLEVRKQGHLADAKKGLKRHLYNAMNKYGVENFEFEEICTAESIEELNQLETKYILEYDSVNNGYNMGYGGDNNVMFCPKAKAKHLAKMRSREVRLKISKTMKKHREENPFSLETRQKISKKLAGNKHFEGQKISEAHKEALKKSHYKKVHCINEQNEIVARFDTVQSAAIWWFENGYSSVKNALDLCDRIKQSSKQDIFIKGLKWVYE